MNDDEILPAELRDALAALPREIEAPAGLEERTVEALRRAGALGEAPAPQRRRSGTPAIRLLRLAAVLGLVAIGYGLGHLRGRAEPAAGPRYLLLLREDGSFRLPPEGEAALVEEYRLWARDLRHGHRLVVGEKLENLSWTLPATPSPAASTAPAISGFFILSAPDDATAQGIARRCPHLRHGGTIEVRRISPT